MNIGIIGCGYVFDIYMNTFRHRRDISIVGVSDIDNVRLRRVRDYFGVKTYESNAELLNDPKVEVVLNLTSIKSHYEVTRAAIEAGKHVYCEKPLTTDLAQARELFALAKSHGVRLCAAPCNPMSPAVQTMWRALREGAVGNVQVVYAECDDNPIYLMQPETWSNPSGAPWPYIEEYESGCTFEHAGYYLSWLAAMFGPASSMTAFSKCLAPNKTPMPLNPPDTPDFSVACIEFASGVTARLTCSIVAPFDQRFRVIGDQGELSMNTYRDYECPVRLERFSSLSLNARKSVAVREITPLQWIFGIGGRTLRLLRRPGGPSFLARWRNPIRTLMKRQLGGQDKCLGLAEMAAAIQAGRAPWLTPEFILHVTELTLAMQRAGPEGGVHRLETTFEPLEPLPFSQASAFRLNLKVGVSALIAASIFERLHKHGARAPRRGPRQAGRDGEQQSGRGLELGA